MLSNEQLIRLEVLKLAQKHHMLETVDHSTDAIIKTANKFEQFLNTDIKE